MREVILFEGVSFRRNGRGILRDVDWSVRAGEHWAVVGANGSGKTTLLRVAGGELFPSGGVATVLGGRFGATDLFALRRRIGWVGPALLSRVPASESALDAVLSGLKATFGTVYEYSEEDRAKAAAALSRVGMADFLHAPFGVLSQGEQQKTLMARAMVSEPELLILDEACSGLDVKARESFLRVVDAVAASGRGTVALVTHHIEEIPPAVTHALIMKEGRVMAAGPVADVLASRLLTDAFGVVVTVERHNGRFWARTGG